MSACGWRQSSENENKVKIGIRKVTIHTNKSQKLSRWEFRGVQYMIILMNFVRERREEMFSIPI